MARASRSQRATQPSQSQVQADPEEEEVEEENHEEEYVNMDEGSRGDELTRKANDLVRLALFTEHKRTALRREDISKKGT